MNQFNSERGHTGVQNQNYIVKSEKKKRISTRKKDSLEKKIWKKEKEEGVERKEETWQKANGTIKNGCQYW